MISVQNYTPTLFWSEVAPQLRHQPAQNNLMLGLSYSLRDKPSDGSIQLAAFQQQNFLGALMLTSEPYYNLVVSQVADPTVAVALLQKLLQTPKLKMNGIVGERHTIELYADSLTKSGFQITPLVHQGIYRCRKVEMPTLVAGANFRQAIESEVELTAEWMEAFRAEAVPHDPAVDLTKTAEERIRGGLVHFIDVNGKPVSMAQYGRDIGTSAAINFVYTPVEFRGHGYGSAVTAHLTKKLLDGGRAEIHLYTDMANATSNKIYQAIGYEFVCESMHLRIE